MTTMGSGLPFPNGGSKLSGAGHSPCGEVGAVTQPLPARVEAPPRAKAPAGYAPALTPAQGFALTRQLGDPPSEPASDLLRYTRMVKPFPVRGLADALYYIGADASLINTLLIHAQIAQPTTAEQWVETLDHLLETIWSLGQRCEEATVALNRMVDEADTQAERGEAAVRAIIAGLRAG